MPDHLDDVIQTLYQRRTELEAELQRVNAALKALVPPTSVTVTPATATATASAPPPGIQTQRLSVRQMVVILLDEGNRDWSVSEILYEYERRGTPVHGANPDKSVRAGILEAEKAGQIQRTDRGRYRSTKFVAPYLTPDPTKAIFGGGQLPPEWQLGEGDNDPE